MLNLNLKDKSILIVDDVEDNRSLLGFYLESSQAILLFAKDGKEAVDMCRADSDIDLVMMDIQMPILNGIEATYEIRKFDKQVPIIAVTAYDNPRDIQSCLDAGCNDFLLKPIDFDKMLNLMKIFLLPLTAL